MTITFTDRLLAHKTSIVFGGVCEPDAENLENYWSEIDVTWQKYVPWGTLELVDSR